MASTSSFVVVMSGTNEITVTALTSEKPPLVPAAEVPAVRVIDVECAPETTALSTPSSAALPAMPLEPLRRLVDNRMVAVGLLLFVGPVGLLAVWMNRRFHRVTKIAWTTFYVALTVVVPIALTCYFCGWALRPLVDAFGDF